MRIDEALRITRNHARWFTEMAGHLARGNGKESAVERILETATALETVCAALEKERNRNAATKPVDFLSDSGGDERNGAR